MRRFRKYLIHRYSKVDGVFLVSWFIVVPRCGLLCVYSVLIPALLMHVSQYDFSAGSFFSRSLR